MVLGRFVGGFGWFRVLVTTKKRAKQTTRLWRPFSVAVLQT